MKTLAYLRVSKNTQDVKNQKLAILEFAHKEKIEIHHFVELSVSCRKSTKERKIDQLLEQLSGGDSLIVSELSRMGRSVGEIITTIDTLVRKDISFIAIKEGIRLNGEQSLQTKVMITMFGLFAEIERDLISERTKEGLARARAMGKLLGRPKGPGKSRLDPYKKEIISLLKTGSSKTYLAKKYNVTPPTLYNWLKKNKITVAAEF